jgi:hypothetical protein
MRDKAVTETLRFEEDSALVHAIKTDPNGYEWGTTYCLMYFTFPHLHMEAPSRYFSRRDHDVVSCFGCLVASP